MPAETFIAIDHAALHDKSRVYIGRAIARKGADDLDEYQLWASLALELLGKAALAEVHPSLIVDPTHWQSLFAAAGVRVTTDIKTITAKTLFERLTHLVPRFDKTLKDFCVELAERRNAELHSADLPFRTMRLDAWEASYWHACDTILGKMSSSLEDWLGAADAMAPRRVLEEAANARASAVKLRVDAARKRFEALKRDERERFAIDAELRHPGSQGSLFRRAYDEIWSERCPACACKAFMAGDQTDEDINEEADELGIWEIVDRAFAGEEFRCPTCEVALHGTLEIEAAGMDHVHEDRQERELEYEPDYGND